METAQTQTLAKWNADGIENAADAKAFLSDVIAYLGLGYHPDTPYGHYIDVASGEPSFSDEDAERLMIAEEKAEQFIDLYEVGLELMETGGRPTEGTRVRLRRDVDRFPFFVAHEGATGTVEECARDLLSVKMDDDLPGSEEWDNCILWTEDSLSYWAEDLAVIGRDEPGEIVDASTTEEDLDAATEQHRAGRGAPTEPCQHGHFECSYAEGGECEQEAVAGLVAERQAAHDAGVRIAREHMARSHTLEEGSEEEVVDAASYQFGINASSHHDTEAELIFTLEVKVPRSEAPALARRLTGNDDDAILAAEKALRAALEEDDEVMSSALEIDTPGGLREWVHAEGLVEERCRLTYGPPA
jgi:hypothetical protein